ncbi:MAG: CotH kinase family protein [Deltaproteobacteria bacterium]|nr:CotH kinase family protein [Deltaproteobacteria bacterium]MBM4391413.1 CotH kinase family protein [Deltaproteobacteria bacterium]
MIVALWACTPRSIETLHGDSAPPRAVDTGVELAPGDTASDADTAEPEGPEGDLYDPSAIHALTLELSDEAYRELERDGRDFVPATLGFEGYQFEVAIHIKGSSSWQPIGDKPSLIVDINHYDPEQEFLGLKKFYLHNDCYDPSQMSSSLSYGFYREWGYPASRSGFAQLELNGRDYGLYVVVEPHNDDFLQAWFDDPNGNLYENAEAYCDVTDVSCMEVEENDEGNDDALRALGQAARLDGAEWEEAMRAHLDWERWVAYLALERSIVHWDSYSYDLSNYQLYHEPSRDKWTFLTQSMDLDYGYRPWSYEDCGMYGMDLDKYDMGMLAQGCEENDACMTEMAAAVMAYADLLEAADGAARVRELDALIGEAVRADPRRYWSDAEYEVHVACLQDFFEARPRQLRDWAGTFLD